MFQFETEIPWSTIKQYNTEYIYIYYIYMLNMFEFLYLLFASFFFQRPPENFPENVPNTTNKSALNPSKTVQKSPKSFPTTSKQLP